MAQQDIYLDLEQLNTDIIVFTGKKIQDIGRAINAARNTANSLARQGWEGDTQEAFAESFSLYIKDMEAFSDHLKEFNKQLKTIHANGKSLSGQSIKIASKL